MGMMEAAVMGPYLVSFYGLDSIFDLAITFSRRDRDGLINLKTLVDEEARDLVMLLSSVDLMEQYKELRTLSEKYESERKNG